MADSAANEDFADAHGRASYLFAGRRVRISDLITEGLLDIGAQLTFRRPLIGETHVARVTNDHLIELIDGQQFRTPSSAAAAAVGAGSFDGWHAWTLDDGTTLDSLRQRLLDSVVAKASDTEEAVEAATTRHENLKRAREKADQGDPVNLTGRELLGWWGARSRGYLISRQVRAELANHSLSTSPDFEAVNLDAQISLVSIPASTHDKQESEDTPTRATPADSSEEDDAPVLGLTVGNLPSALTGVVAVSPSATFEEAITKMAINGYSQLAVLAGSRILRGAVTWESIARSRHADPEATFSKAIVRAYEVKYDQHLIDILPLLADANFVFIKNQTNNISGIVTSDDVAAIYGAMATPFFLIGELDQRLRRILSDAFSMEYVEGLVAPDGDRKIRSFDDLSIGDYQRVLQNRDAWKTLGWPLDRKSFVERIDELREIRNDLMHFNPDPIPSDAVQKIRHMILLLREYGN